MNISQTTPLHDLLEFTPILDYQADNIQQLVRARGWATEAKPEEAARAIYNFCKDEIRFGYNASADNMPASKVLAEGLGHCNTKSTLLMALLRCVGIPCQLHAFTIHKRLQRGAMTPFVYAMAPKEIIHTWTEAWINHHWLVLEGVILDQQYLQSVQARFKGCANHTHPFLGYAVATRKLGSPNVEWTGESTFIQREGIARELGLYKTPDEFYAKHPTNLQGVRGWLYKNYFYKRLNANIDKIRQGQIEVSDVKQPCER